MSNRVTTLDQLHYTAQKAHGAAARVAAAAAEAIEEVDASKMDKADAVAVTLPAAGWNSEEELAEEGKADTAYPCTYDIQAPGVTARDRADLTVAPESIEAAMACGLCPVSETLDGAIRLRAVSVPAEEIRAEYWLSSGKE